ncbi:hypothetical protein M409DRAFT_29356 [Zasmidium cellare ATCC 36951]|uniref:Uncharacterized protein n=1 Tax=Zasmidium cellare ATCC 36951 TaxID=1080233 RepID=A0A6A6BZP0_ZASCE|nr:uncharacterized protein M409DRAFT_29356 [Zasmidium cellare ATCC 36951]KAF2160267.1 hypothetical protein M409DRAFT_29356 [Zasmidium cellare ATCC 36951]
MGLARSFVALATSTFILQAQAGPHPRHFKHQAVKIERRQDGPPIEAPTTQAEPAVTTSNAVLTYITPSPGATPIPITEQSQLVTSFVPQFTICDLPPQAVFPVTPLPQTTITAPYRNYSISIPTGTGTCETIYSPTNTMVCATTLTGLVSQYTVSACDQDITFSTEYGYVLARPTVNATVSAGLAASASAAITPAPTIQTLTTYLVAPWEAVTAGLAPEEVRLKVCAKYANGTNECIEQYEVWHTSLLTETATTTTSVNISTTIHGNAQVIVATYAANITEAVSTFRMTTDMELEYKTELETTEREKVTPTTAPTSYITMTLENATPTSSDAITTIRSTIRRTSTTTVYVGTSTATLPDVAAPATTAPPGDDGALPTPTDSVDWVSMLGIETAR